MANTRPNISVPQGAWLNLNTASGITVGVASTLYNKGSFNINIAISAAAPTDLSGMFGIPVLQATQSVNTFSIPAASSAVWAWSPTNSTLSPGLVLLQD